MAITKDVNILVYPCGSEIALEIHRSLKNIRFVNLVGASGGDDHGRYVYDQYVGDVPFYDDPAFVDSINEIVKYYNIDYIFPAHDGVLFEMSEQRHRIDVPLLTSSKDAVNLCRYKHLTYSALANFEFAPRVFSNAQEVNGYPVILKPSAGSAAVGVYLCNSPEELSSRLSMTADQQVIVEYLPGEELTIDCFTDSKGIVQYAGGRVRERVRSGISVRSTRVNLTSMFSEMATAISDTLGMAGAWYFQVKKNQDGEFKLLEVASRVAGTMCVSRAAGVNIPLLAVLDKMGESVSASPQFEQVQVDRAFDAKYKLNFKIDHLYLDYDDTLIVHDRVNLEALSLVYQCVEAAVPVTLITRHVHDVHSSLRARRIDPALFSKITALDRGQSKADFIDYSPGALLIDDSFGERQAVVQDKGIKAIGPDAIEAFLK